MTKPPETGGVRRREFLKILGASTAAGAAAACSPRVDNLIPFVVSQDNTVPGVSNYYSTTCRECAAACGILVETRDGRAIKIEGNVEHPLNRGALCARGQSALQGLYNPDRYRGPMMRRGTELVPVTWDEATTALTQRLTELRSAGTASNAAFINQHESGSFPAFLDEWLAAFGMPPHLSYDAALDSGTIAANKQSYGVAWPGLDFAAARLIISFGADFLETWGASVTHQLSFADARAKIANAPRFIYVGPRRSLTGLNADEWIDCKPGSELQIAEFLLRSIGGVNEGSIRPDFGTVAVAATASGVSQERLERLAREFAATKPSLVVAGANSVHGYDLALTANAMNQRAGNVGVTVKPEEAITSFEGAASDAHLNALATRMRAGEIPAVFIRGANPAYTSPKSAQFAEALARVPFKVSFTSYPDETSALCDLVLPDHHALEQWGDSTPLSTVISYQQPAMDPVFNTRASADVLIALGKANPATAARYPFKDYRSWLVERSQQTPMQFAAQLRTAVVTRSAGRMPPARTNTAPAQPTAEIESTQGDFYFVTYLSPTLGDGRGTNKPWLQELPDPVSKICWQSWIEIHPETAKRLGVAPGDHLTVETGSGSITAPAYVYLGVRQDTVAMPLGQGHTRYGRYAEGVGVNALDAQPASFDARSGALARVATKARVTRVGAHSILVSTEGSARQHGRGIARAVTVAQLPELGKEKPSEFMGDASHAFLPGLRAPVANDAQGELGDPASNQKGMYRDDHYSGMAKRRWAMTVDLARCTGCSACVTACYAENNIPTVGAPWQGPKIFPDRTGPGANIIRSREMAWLRLERYFEGGEHGEPDFETRFVPMMCQHCGNAPCEPVCPVFATYHAPDGLNVQVYNRCVGTRYCSNNCPYKVRYFNWFGYGEKTRSHYAFPEPLNWQLNPDVTVRSKGVMEKCTFCVQRIREAESRAVLEGREMAADEFTTACAQGCPSRAIVFGDAADPAWAVTKNIADHRGYHVFEELNTYTAVVYLHKVLHGAPAPAAAGAVGAASLGGGTENGD